MSTFRFLCLILWGLTYLASAQGQNPITVKKIKFSLENAPQYAVLGGSRPGGGIASNEKWVVFEVEFETAPEWVNEATFDMFVLVKNENVYQNLRGTAVFQDIEKGSGHKVAMFMSPQTYKRYAGVSSQQAIQDVAVKVTVGGAVVDTFSERAKRKTTQRWWEQIAPQDAILRSMRYTPWFPLYFGYYEQLKPD